MGLNNIDHLALFNTRPNELEVQPTFSLLYININWVLSAKDHLRDIA
jgi:demethoxyubiquinone hydroxylase (CLK1/Coq7/Cat5 family)